MTNTTVCKKPAEVVIELLGVRALARALDLTPGAVSMWQESGLVPSKHHQRIIEIAAEQNKTLTPDMLVYGVRG